MKKEFDINNITNSKPVTNFYVLAKKEGNAWIAVSDPWTISIAKGLLKNSKNPELKIKKFDRDSKQIIPEARGGARKGSGKPVKSRVLLTYNIDTDLIPYLDKVGNRSDFVNEAIRQKMKKEKIL